MKFGSTVLQVNNQLTSYVQDAGLDVISWKKVLSSGECRRQHVPVPDPQYIRACFVNVQIVCIMVRIELYSIMYSMQYM